MMSCWHCPVANPGYGGRTALRGLARTAGRQLRELAGAQSLLARSGDAHPPDLRRDSPPSSANTIAHLAVVLLVMGTLLGVGSVASAHHSATMFEQTKTITVEGVVKEFQWTNPHSWLLVDVTDKSGKVTTWGFEAEGPSTLQRAGIRPSEFRPGTKLTITGRPMKDGRPAAIWVEAVREDGKRFDPREGFRVK